MPWLANGEVDKMIKIHNVKAARLASYLCGQTKNQSLSCIALRPDGSLVGSDGIGLVHSYKAHDSESDEALYVRPSKQIGLSTIGLTLDLVESVLIEHRAKSESRMSVEVFRGLAYPDISRYLPNHLAKKPKPGFGFDSVKGGKMASAYGLDRGFWREHVGERVVCLDDTDEGDTVVLGGMVKE